MKKERCRICEATNPTLPTCDEMEEENWEVFHMKISIRTEGNHENELAHKIKDDLQTHPDIEVVINWAIIHSPNWYQDI